MQTGDTSLGGRGKRFPDTTWSLVARFGDLSAEEHRSALEELCRRYWKPIYCWLRIALSRSNDDAKDITQEFFAWLMEGEELRRYKPEKGGFRAFLKMILNGFVKNRDKAARRIKRGGGRVVSLDEASVAALDIIGARETDPEAAFDRVWIRQIYDLAVDRVRERYQSAGKGKLFRVYEEYDYLDREPRPSYAQLAERLDLSLGAVEAHLFSIREQVRTEMRGELARVTADDRELEDEWNALFGIRRKS